MSAKEFFTGIFGKYSESTEINLLAPFSLKFNRDAFCEFKTEILFKKILEGCLSRTEGIKDKDKIASLFDSYEKSGSGNGLISIIAMAMRQKREIAIIYDSGVVRFATFEETQEIKKDYLKKAKSEKGVLVDFSRYCLTDLIFGYMSMIYDIIDSMNTQVGLAKSLQIKINSLRGTVSTVGKEEPVQQAKDINESLKNGKSVLMDKNDSVESLKIDSASIDSAINFVFSLIASDLGFSLSFISGALTTGMSATGEADVNKDEYGFLNFFNSIFKPICDKLYNWDLVFMSDDWRYFDAMIGSLIIVENSSLLSDEQKKAFADRLMPVANKK